MGEETPKSEIKVNPDEITSEYANNTYFVRNIWDLKILFGELGIVGQEIDWHTAVTLPWPQAKLMAFYLQINILAHEQEQGPIKVPKNMLPPPPPQTMDAPLVKYIQRLREEFMKTST